MFLGPHCTSGCIRAETVWFTNFVGPTSEKTTEMDSVCDTVLSSEGPWAITVLSKKNNGRCEKIMTSQPLLNVGVSQV